MAIRLLLGGGLRCPAYQLRTPRPEHAVPPAGRARTELRRCRDTHFDARVVGEFLALEALGVVGTRDEAAVRAA